MISKYYLGTCFISSLSQEDRDKILTSFTLNLWPLTSRGLFLSGNPGISHQISLSYFLRWLFHSFSTFLKPFFTLRWQVPFLFHWENSSQKRTFIHSYYIYHLVCIYPEPSFLCFKWIVHIPIWGQPFHLWLDLVPLVYSRPHSGNCPLSCIIKFSFSAKSFPSAFKYTKSPILTSTIPWPHIHP